MADVFKPHSYQEFAIKKILELPALALFLDMGLGKTACSLIAITQLLWDYFSVSKVLIVAPKKVAESTWDSEIKKWDITQQLKISKILGTASERQRALAAEADIYIINRDNVVWLMEQLHWRPKMFNMLILDESSSFKNHQAKRFKALRKVRPYFEKVLELTGTPGDKLMDLWAQIYLLDGGKRLGRTITEYRNRWFVPDKSNGYVVYSYKPKPGAEQEIYAAISEITFSMSAGDWLELPERIDNVISVDMGTGARARYKELERLLVLELPEGDVTAATAATLSNKLLQMANGAVYDENKGVIDIHDEKLVALKEIAESGNPILVFYAYRHDRDRLLKWFNYARELKTPEDVNDWNAGKIKMLITHPASAGYGLNLQAGGNTIVWFGLTWSLEQYKQANARLYRQGQQQTVIIHHLVTKGTMDEQVMAALAHKDASQAELLAAVKARVEQYRTGAE